VILANSTWRTLLATAFVVGGLVWLYEETILDSRFAVKQGDVDPQPPPKPGSRLFFSATAYCKGSTTASGVNVRSGIAAADPDLLPVGSVVQVDAPGARYDGVYTVMDTGPKVQGRHVDLYMWSCHEALRFGRAAVRVSVLRLGWSPAQSSPGLVDRLFRRREAAAQAAPPAQPPPPSVSPSPPDSNLQSNSSPR
jgi:3D (Asp-Asp-Asp) domain-containing protein